MANRVLDGIRIGSLEDRSGDLEPLHFGCLSLAFEDYSEYVRESLGSRPEEP